MTKKLIKISKYRPSIFQGTFDFAGQAGQVSLTLEHPLERGVRVSLIAAVALLACAYLFFVTSSVLNVIARKEASANVASVQSAIGGLEQRYFQMSQDVTLSRGSELGLVAAESTEYVHRPGNAALAVDSHSI